MKWRMERERERERRGYGAGVVNPRKTATGAYFKSSISRRELILGEWCPDEVTFCYKTIACKQQEY